MLSHDQVTALDEMTDFLKCVDHQEHILTGSPGMGKSYMTKEVIDVCEDISTTVLMAATTHKAAKILSEFSGREVFTIHSLLGLIVWNDYANNTSKLVRSSKEYTPLDEQMTRAQMLVVIDEASMLDDNIKAFINKALNEYSQLKILYVGDKNQLGPITEDKPIIFHMGIPMSILTTVHRQKEGSSIISIADELKESIDQEDWFVEALKSSTDVHLLNKDELKSTVDRLYDSNEYNADINYVKCLAFRNKTVNEFNTYIRTLFYSDPEFQIGERLVVNKALIRNSKTLFSTETIVEVLSNNKHEIRGIACRKLKLQDDNGAIHIASVSPHKIKIGRVKKQLIKDKNFKEMYDFVEAFVDVRPVYAATVHKSQGSTYDNVIINVEDICSCPTFQDVSRLIYVAITRAKHNVYVFGNVPKNFHR